MRLNKEKYLRVKKISVMLVVCIMIFNIVLPLIDINELSFNSVKARISENLPVSYIDEDFPESYKPYIDELKKIYPNAVFKAVHTNVDWNLAINQETYLNNIRISTVSNSYPNVWKYMPNGSQIYIDGSFVAASIEGVKYVLDPRNSLTKELIFQFESLYFSDKTSSEISVDKLLSSTPMSSTGVYGKKYKNNNKWIDMEHSYAYYIFKAGQINNINPVHIASRIIQETSGNIANNSSINGSVANYTGLYNFFNIGATPNGNTNNSVINGLKYARSKGWTTPEKAIIEGSVMLAEKYIKYGQNTIYFQKFDVNNPGNASHLFGSQYMTHIIAPQSESKLMYKAYSKANMLNSSFEFHIPVYLNMPNETVNYPGTGNNVGNVKFRLDGVTKVYLNDPIDTNVADIFKLRKEPSTSSDTIVKLYEVKEGMENRTVYDLLSVDLVNGFGCIRLANGTTGYISLEYIYEYIYTKVSTITLNNTDVKLDIGNTFDLKANINPSNAKFKEVTYTSSNKNIATVDSNGKITAIAKGNTEIKVKSENGVTAKCKVTVKDNPIILFKKDKYTVYLNDSINVNPTISNTTLKDYELVIEDNNIARVENGKVKGIKIGKTNITAIIKGTNIKVTAPLNVVVKDLNNPVIFDESLNINNKVISNINPASTVKTVLDKINTKYKVTATKDNKTLTKDDMVGTGVIIKITDDKTLNLQYQIVIYGDASGDGKISSLDYVMIKKYIMEEYNLTGVYSTGADVSKDNKVSSLDYVMIKKYIMEELDIKQ